MDTDTPTLWQRREAIERAVALAGSLSAAARAEGVTRQALQQRIRRLGGTIVTEVSTSSRIEWGGDTATTRRNVAA